MSKENRPFARGTVVIHEVKVSPNQFEPVSGPKRCRIEMALDQRGGSWHYSLVNLEDGSRFTALDTFLRKA
jgi:hypothetical protein